MSPEDGLVHSQYKRREHLLEMLRRQGNRLCRPQSPLFLWKYVRVFPNKIMSIVSELMRQKGDRTLPVFLALDFLSGLRC